MQGKEGGAKGAGILRCSHHLASGVTVIECIGEGVQDLEVA